MGESFHNMPIRLPDGWAVLDGGNKNPDRSPSAAMKDRLQVVRGEKPKPAPPCTAAQAKVAEFAHIVEVLGYGPFVFYTMHGRQYEVTHIFVHEGIFAVMRAANPQDECDVQLVPFAFDQSVYIGNAPRKYGATQFAAPG